MIERNPGSSPMVTVSLASLSRGALTPPGPGPVLLPQASVPCPAGGNQPVLRRKGVAQLPCVPTGLKRDQTV